MLRIAQSRSNASLFLFSNIYHFLVLDIITAWGNECSEKPGDKPKLLTEKLSAVFKRNWSQPLNIYVHVLQQLTFQERQPKNPTIKKYLNFREQLSLGW